MENLTPIQWIRDQYPITYDTAKTAPHQLYFDPRCWSAAEIRTFYQDLRFADVVTWERLRGLRGSIISTAAAEKRYKKWCASYFKHSS